MVGKGDVVHAGEELSHYSTLHFSLGGLAFGGDGIYFIDEDETWRYSLFALSVLNIDRGNLNNECTNLGIFEYISQRSLTLPTHPTNNTWSAQTNERQPQLSRNRIRQQRLPTPRWSMKQHTSRR